MAKFAIDRFTAYISDLCNLARYCRRTVVADDHARVAPPEVTMGHIFMSSYPMWR